MTLGLLWPAIHSSAHLNLGMIQLQEHLATKTNRPFSIEALLSAAQGQSNAYWALGLEAYRRGDQAQAHTYWAKLLLFSPQRIPLVSILAPAESALAQLAVRRHPTHPQAYTWLGEVLAQEDPTGAAQAYRTALAMRPYSPQWWLRLAQIQYQLGNLEAAARAADQACVLHDRGGNGCPLAGRAYAQMGDLETAADRYREAIAQIPTIYLPVEQGFVDVLLQLGRYEEAIPHLKILAAAGQAEAAATLDQVQKQLHDQR